MLWQSAGGRSQCDLFSYSQERLYGGTGISGHLWRAERKIWVITQDNKTRGSGCVREIRVRRKKDTWRGQSGQVFIFSLCFSKVVLKWFSVIFLMSEANQCRLCVGVHFSCSLCSLLSVAPWGSKASASCFYFAAVPVQVDWLAHPSTFTHLVSSSFTSYPQFIRS